jgi:hypothetical protein
VLTLGAHVDRAVDRRLPVAIEGPSYLGVLHPHHVGNDPGVAHADVELRVDASAAAAVHAVGVSPAGVRGQPAGAYGPALCCRRRFEQLLSFGQAHEGLGGEHDNGVGVAPFGAERVP